MIFLCSDKVLDYGWNWGLILVFFSGLSIKFREVIKPLQHYNLMKKRISEWKEFENKAREAMEKKLHTDLSSKKITVKGEYKKKFDLVNEKKLIVGDVKHYKNTEGGNSPSAKRSILNEYILLMQKMEWKKKIIIISKDREMADSYVKSFSSLLKDDYNLEIYFFLRKSKKGLIMIWPESKKKIR